MGKSPTSRQAPRPLNHGRRSVRSLWIPATLGVAAVLTFAIASPDLAGATRSGLVSSLSGQVKPHFTSNLRDTVVEGKQFSYVVTATGQPVPTLFALQNTLPPGLTFVTGAPGTGTLKGTSTKPGKAIFQVKAANAAGIVADTFTIQTSEPQAPVVKEYSTVEGKPFEKSVPNPTIVPASTGSINCSGKLPVGTKLAPGTKAATLSGVPRQSGSFVLKCLADDESTKSTETWPFTLSVSASGTKPFCIPNQFAGIPAGQNFESGVTALGTPTPNLAPTGQWPRGAIFVNNDNGTGVVSGNVSVPQAYKLHVRASNPLGTCTEAFELTVSPVPPTFASPAAATVAANKAFDLAIVVTGIPTPTVTLGAGAPRGIAIETRNGTLGLVGTIRTAGTFGFNLDAKNSAGSVAQHFVLTVTSTSTPTTATTGGSTTSSSTSTSTSSTTTSSSTSTTSTTTSTTTTTTTLPTAPPPAGTTITVGSYPYGVAVDSATGMAYVSNEDANSLSVINESTGQVVKTITGFDEPEGLAVNPSTNTVYLSNFANESLSIINVSNNYSVSTVGSVCIDPNSVALNPTTGLVYIGCYFGSEVQVYSPTGTFDATIPIAGSNIHAVVYDPSNGDVLVTDYNQNEVAAINTSTNQLISPAPITGLSGPDGIAVDSANGDIYVAVNYGVNGDRVAVYNSSFGSISTIITPGDPNFMAADSADNTIFASLSSPTSGLDGSVAEISGSTNAISTTVPVGVAPIGIDVDQSTGRVFVANSGSSTVTSFAG